MCVYRVYAYRVLSYVIGEGKQGFTYQNMNGNYPGVYYSGQGECDFISSDCKVISATFADYIFIIAATD